MSAREIEALRKIRAAVEAAEEIGDAKLFYQDGRPCCAIGHGLAAGGFAPPVASFDTGDYGNRATREMRYACASLGISVATYHCVAIVNDNNGSDTRKSAVLVGIDREIARLSGAL